MVPYTSPATLAVTVDTSVELVAAPGARAFINIHNMAFSNQSVTDTFVDVLDGATIILRKQAVPAGLGNNVRFEKPLRLSENSALNVQASAAVTTLNVSVAYEVEPNGLG